MSDKLMPCMCCGSDSIYKTFEYDNIGTEIPIIFCNTCKIVFRVENDSPYLSDKETYKYLAEKTVKAWNTRKPVERILERLEEMLKAYETQSVLLSDSEKAFMKAIEIVKEEGGIEC